MLQQLVKTFNCMQATMTTKMKMKTTLIELQNSTGNFNEKICDSRIWAAWKRSGYNTDFTRSKWYDDCGEGDVNLRQLCDARTARISQQ